MNIGVIGCGYVGLVSATGFAELGHNVVAAESDTARLKLLHKGRSPFHEPYLPELLRKHTGARRPSALASSSAPGSLPRPSSTDNDLWTQEKGSPLGSATQRLVVAIS